MGADLGFSRGGGGGEDFQKVLENFDELFIWVGKIDFPSSPKAQKRHFFAKIFGAADKFLKNRSKKPFLGTFWKIVTKNAFFLAPAPPRS